MLAQKPVKQNQFIPDKLLLLPNPFLQGSCKMGIIALALMLALPAAAVPPAVPEAIASILDALTPEVGQAPQFSPG
jgi:hypothetical protein